MLVVGPGSRMAPTCVSVAVLMTSTTELLTAELNASRVFLSGDIAMRPGELPALIPPLTNVSI